MRLPMQELRVGHSYDARERFPDGQAHTGRLHAGVLRRESDRVDAVPVGEIDRAFDMELGEAYGCPHDVGWAVLCSESGWTDAEILMGLMMPDILARMKKR